MWAALGGHDETVTMILQRMYRFEALDGLRASTMTFAACGGNPRVVQHLLRRQSAVDIRDHKGRSPFWYASHYSNLEAMQTLLEAGASVDCKDSDGITPLANAARRGQTSVVQFLLRLNTYDLSYEPVKTLIRLDSRDLKGRTPLVLAVEADRVDCVKALTQHNPARLSGLHEQDIKTAKIIASSQRNLKILELLGGSCILPRRSTGSGPYFNFPEERRGRLDYSWWYQR